MPKDDNQQNQNSQSQQVDDAPVFMEEATPPILTTPPDISNSSPVDANTASSAPSDDLPKSTPLVGTTAPKKKYGGNRVIATILGVLLLVGGVGAGVFLVQESQDIRERAAVAGSCGSYRTSSTCNSQCSPPKIDGKTYECKWIDGECKESGNLCGGGGGVGGWNAPAELNCNDPICNSAGNGFYSCNGVTYVYCADCVDACVRSDLLPSGCGGYIKNKCGTDYAGNCGNITNPNNVNVYYCEGANIGNACSRKDPLPEGAGWNPTTKQIVGSFCGTIQVDQIGTSGSGLLFCSKYDESGCIKPTPKPEPTPTATPISATCQNVKAYNTSWVELTSSQLSQLGANAQVNFCVTGVASGGSFTKARFTVNNETLPETTTKRPNSNDFCSTYVIKSGINTYNVSAQIYHDSLGWK